MPLRCGLMIGGVVTLSIISTAFSSSYEFAPTAGLLADRGDHVPLCVRRGFDCDLGLEELGVPQVSVADGGDADHNAVIAYLMADKAYSCADLVTENLCGPEAGAADPLLQHICPTACGAPANVVSCGDAGSEVVSAAWAENLRRPHVGNAGLIPAQMDCNRTRVAWGCTDPLYGQLCQASCLRCVDGVPKAVAEAAGGDLSRYEYNHLVLMHEVKTAEYACAMALEDAEYACDAQPCPAF